MRKFIGGSLFIATLGLMTFPQGIRADEVQVEKKTTTTSPSGEVVIENETSRSFKLRGQTRTFVAPADVDLKTLSGKEVTVTVDPNGTVTKVERKTTTTY